MKTPGGQTFVTLLSKLQEEKKAIEIWQDWAKGKHDKVIAHKTMTRNIARLALETSLIEIATTLANNYPEWKITITRTTIKKVPIRELLWPQPLETTQLITADTEPPDLKDCSSSIRWALIIHRPTGHKSKSASTTACGLLITYKHPDMLVIETSNIFKPDEGKNANWYPAHQLHDHKNLENVSVLIAQTVLTYLQQKNLI